MLRSAEPSSYVNKLLAAPTSDNHRHKGEALLAAESYSAAMKEFEEALRNHPTNITRLASADFYSHQGQYPKTVGLLDEVLATEPNNTEALEKLADALDEQGSSRVMETTDRLLKISPESAIGLYHLATIRLYENRLDEAIRTAQHALERDPASSRTRNVLAIAYEKTFQPDLADAEFRTSINRNNDDWVQGSSSAMDNRTRR